MRFSAWRTFGCCLLFVGCGRGGSVAETSDASVAPSAQSAANLPSREPQAATFADGLRGRFKVRRADDLLQIVAAAEATGFDRIGGAIVPRLRPAGATSIGRAAVTLPATADAPFTLAHRDVELSVRIVGAARVPAKVGDGDVTYERAIGGATLLHVPLTIGTEEYFHFEEAPEAREIRYEIALKGAAAGLRLVEGTLEVLSADGNPALHTRAPFVVDAAGTSRTGALRVEGCAYDRDEHGPWGRPIVAPGAKTCTVVASWDDAGLVYPVLVDPAWTSAATMPYRPNSHRATWFTTTLFPACAAPSGCVLATGGQVGGAVATTALYNVAAGTWAAAANLTTARYNHASAATGDGRVVVMGGSSGGATTEIYDPSASPTWKSAGTLPGGARDQLAAGSVQYGATVPPTREIYVTGGRALATNTASNAVDKLNVATLTWTAAPSLATARFGHAMEAWNYCPFNCTAGYLIVAGGSPTGAAAPYIATTEWFNGTTWAAGTPLPVGVRNPAMAPLSNAILLAGGSTGTGYVSAIYTTPKLTPGTWTKLADLTVAREGTRGVSLGDLTSSTTEAMFVGGSPGVTSAYAGRADEIGSAGTVTFSDLATPRWLHQATALGTSRKVLVTGGYNGAAVASDELFSPLGIGAACTSSGECASRNCVDGVCCNAPCAGQCQACNTAGAPGTCTTVNKTNGPTGYAAGQAVTGFGTTRALCAGYGTTCGSYCEGTSATACTYSAATTQCVAPSCASQTETRPSFCTGTGACNVATTKDCGVYACGATACKTSCSTIADCASGFKCDATLTCVPTGDVGSSCNSTPECKTGLSCVDNTCCTSASCGAPMRCDVAGAKGSCKLPNGQSCTTATAGSCGSGICADGKCCNEACTGQCEACDVGMNAGTCTAVLGAVHGTRTACIGTGACQAACDGSNRATCAPAPPPTAVCAAATCSGSTAAPTRFCDGLGVCGAVSPTNCGSYTCGATACKTSCTAAGDCAAGYFCNASGACVTTGALGTLCSAASECGSGKCTDGVCCTVDACTTPAVCNANGAGTCARPIAAGCTADSQCGSGHCADGVCCDKACSGQCEACDVGGSIGTCTAVSGKPHASRTACSGTGACQAVCDGSNRIACGAPPGTSTTCGTPTCAAGVAKLAAYCDGAGNCPAATTKPCSPYLCDAAGGACLTTCAAATDCATGYTCKDNLCIPKAGVACTTKNDCASGFCVDGVCCDGPCGGQCEACDIPGLEGKCSGVSGPPHGTTRTACSDGGADVCRALSCDGTKDRTKCVGFANGPDKECTPASCAAATATAASYCDGTGTCKAGATTSCNTFACDAKSCKTACKVDQDCNTGFTCDTTSSKCVPPRPTCSADGLSTVPADKSLSPTSCGPYQCSTATGDCFPRCATSDQCSPGNTCDGANCIPGPAAGANSSGGCAVDGHPASSQLALGALALGAIALGRRRRRAR